MKTFYFLFLLPLVMGFTRADAQHNPAAREKIEAQKVAYITSVLDLSPSEAQLFWPIYNEQQQKRQELRRARMSERKESAARLESMSEKEAETLVDQEIEFKQKDLDIQKDLHVKLKKVISSKKIARLYKAEVDFQRKVLKDLGGRHKEEPQ